MSLMITLDDAMFVLTRGGYLDEGYIDENGGAEVVRSELEQKCYSMMKRGSEKWFDIIKEHVEGITDPGEISKHIGSGDLNKWLEMCRDNIIAELTLAAREGYKPRISSIEQRCGNCNKVIEMDGWKVCPWCGKSILWEAVGRSVK